MSKIVMLAPVNFLRSYSGFQYLADFLYKKGFDIEVYAQIPEVQKKEIRKLPYPVYSSHFGIIGKIPKVRHFFFKRKIHKALNTCNAVILNTTNPIGYFHECVAFKKKFPEKIFIQYCTEFWMPHEQSRYSEKEKIFFLKNADTADIIIDVEFNRARLRKKHFNINKNIEIIPNTLPNKILKKKHKTFSFEKKCNINIKCNQKILLYTGQLSTSSLTEIHKIMNGTSENIVLIWFAHGISDLIQKAREETSKNREGNQKIYICDPIPRDELIGMMYQADAGLIIYSYSHTDNMNLKYAAPTKLYEYISSGLPIVSYGNPSIKLLVDQYNLGICSDNDNPDSLGSAINELFERKDFDSLKESVKNVFVDNLCYEKSAEEALNNILKILGK